MTDARVAVEYGQQGEALSINVQRSNTEMQSRGQKFEELKKKLIAAAMHVGRLTADPIIDPEASAAKLRLEQLSAELTASFNHAEAPFRKGDLVRPMLNSSGYVEPLKRLGRDAAIIRRTDHLRIHDMLYHGDGHWSLSFVAGDHRYPAEDFEFVPRGAEEPGRPEKRAKRCVRQVAAA